MRDILLTEGAMAQFRGLVAELNTSGKVDISSFAQMLKADPRIISRNVVADFKEYLATPGVKAAQGGSSSCGKAFRGGD